MKKTDIYKNVKCFPESQYSVRNIRFYNYKTTLIIKKNDKNVYMPSIRICKRSILTNIVHITLLIGHL